MSDTTNDDNRTYEEITKDLDTRWEIYQLNRINEKNKPVNKKEGINISQTIAVGDGEAVGELYTEDATLFAPGLDP